MIDILDLYQKLIKWPLLWLFKLVIDWKTKINIIVEGVNGNQSSYRDNYKTLSIASFAYDIAKSRHDQLITKLIALTQIHGAVFAIVAFGSDIQNIIAIVMTYASMGTNVVSVILVIHSLTIKKSVQPEFKGFSDDEKLDASTEKEIDDSISFMQDRSDFLADMFKLAQVFLVISIILSVTGASINKISSSHSIENESLNQSAKHNTIEGTRLIDVRLPSDDSCFYESIIRPSIQSANKR